MMHCNKSWLLAVAIPLDTEQSVFCDFQKFLQVSDHETTKWPCPYSITSSDSPQFYSFKSPERVILDTSESKNFVLPVEISPPSPIKAEVQYRCRKPGSASIIKPTRDDSNFSNNELFYSDVSFLLDFMSSAKESVYKDAECIFCNRKFSGDQREEIWIQHFSSPDCGLNQGLTFMGKEQRKIK
ncbi:hypothetical protein TNCV_1642611 [Trichonephila clavipes]|nr:hypothetical protein TNCV_1642611 [Trichonephila clavipes]